MPAASPLPHSTSAHLLATTGLQAQRWQQWNDAFGIASTLPPAGVHAMMQRGDDVNTVQRMLTGVQTSAVFLTGEPGAGKSILAALLYRRFQLTAEAGLPAPKHFAWLTIGPYTTLPDVIAAMLNGINASQPGISFLKPEQQVEKLLQALRRPQDPALVVLDQFEELLYPEEDQSDYRDDISLFLDMLQQELGASRILLTCYRSPYDVQDFTQTRVRSYLVSRISLPEGVALLQQRGIRGSYEELSLIWQRCSGYAFALVLFCTLVKLSGLPPGYFLRSPEYQFLWSGEVMLQLLATIYRYLNPVQHILVRILALFREPVPAQGLFSAIVGENSGVNSPLFEQELALMTRLALVQQLDAEKLPYYTLHPLFRQYILEHYLEGGDLRSHGTSSLSLGVSSPLNLVENNTEAQEVAIAAGHMRVAAYYQRMAQQHYIPLEERTRPHDVRYLLAAARHLCLGWHWQEACDLLLAEGIYESMVQWGAWSTLARLYLEMLPPKGVVTRYHEGLLCNHLGLLYNYLGNYHQSWAYYERALAVQRKIDDRHGEAITLANQGELYRNLGQLEQAYANFRQARVLNRQEQDPLLESVLLQNLGLLHQALKDYRQALRYYQEALRFAQTLPESYNTGMILMNTGMMLYEQGYHAVALAVLLYTLEKRQSLQYSTVFVIEQFLDTLEQQLGREAFVQLCLGARAVQKDVLSWLLSAARAGYKLSS